MVLAEKKFLRFGVKERVGRKQTILAIATAGLPHAGRHQLLAFAGLLDGVGSPRCEVQQACHRLRHSAHETLR